MIEKMKIESDDGFLHLEDYYCCFTEHRRLRDCCSNYGANH